jgi:hypothetical protein
MRHWKFYAAILFILLGIVSVAGMVPLVMDGLLPLPSTFFGLWPWYIGVACLLDYRELRKKGFTA